MNPDRTPDIQNFIIEAALIEGAAILFFTFGYVFKIYNIGVFIAGIITASLIFSAAIFMKIVNKKTPERGEQS